MTNNDMTIRITTLPNGDIQEVRTIPGSMSLVFINGVVQPIASMDYVEYKWQPWFAWRPVKIHNERVWLKKIYRREIPKTYVNHDDWKQYEYGSLFDVIRGD